MILAVFLVSLFPVSPPVDKRRSEVKCAVAVQNETDVSLLFRVPGMEHYSEITLLCDLIVI